MLPTHVSRDGATGDAASWTQHPALPAAPADCQGDGNFSADLYNGCSGSPGALCPEGGILLLMSHEQQSCGAWGQPAPAPLLLHAEGTQGCLYPARPLQLRGMEKRDTVLIKRKRQVVKRTGGLYCCDHHSPSVLAPSWPMGNNRAMWGRHGGGLLLPLLEPGLREEEEEEKKAGRRGASCAQ